MLSAHPRPLCAMTHRDEVNATSNRVLVRHITSSGGQIGEPYGLFANARVALLHRMHPLWSRWCLQRRFADVVLPAVLIALAARAYCGNDSRSCCAAMSSRRGARGLEADRRSTT